MINLEDVKKIDWQYLVSRRESLLHRSILMECYDLCPRVTNIPWKPTVDFRPGPDIFLSRNELQELRNHVEKEGTKGLKDFHARLVRYLGALDHRAKEWEAHAPAPKTAEEVGALLDEFLVLIKEASAFLIPMPTADAVLSQNILRLLPEGTEEDKQNWLKVLAYPIKDNEHTKEERAFYQLIQKYLDRHPAFEELLQAHLREFAWIGSRGCWWNLAWTEQDLRDRIEQFLTSGKHPEEEIRALETSRLDRKAEGEALLSQWGIKPGSDLDEWVKLAKEYAFIRTYRTDVIYGAEYRAGFIFKAIAKRIGWDLYDMSYLTASEAQTAIRTQREPISREELALRREFFGSVLMDGELQIYAGEAGRKLLEGLMEKKDEALPTEVKGSVAFVGKAQGRAKLVFTAPDLKKVERGDVLIAVMTFPHFIAAMEKACAFVTDEGGILCHAAIVSREMRKPCVIATKNATKVFKDGDIIEVDAEKGTVRRIS